MAEKLLDQAVRLTEMLHERSRDADSDVLEPLKRERDRLLRMALDDETIALADKYTVLRRIKALDEETIVHLERQRDEAAQALRQLRTRHQAAASYLAAG